MPSPEELERMAREHARQNPSPIIDEFRELLRQDKLERLKSRYERLQEKLDEQLKRRDP